MKKIAYEEMFENEMTHPWYRATRELMIETLEKYLKKGAKLLDSGCGTGGTILFLNKAGYKNLVGIDISEDALKYCKMRGIKNVSNASINKLPFKSGSFEGIICLDVLYHRGVYPEKALSEFRRVLKKGGIIYVEEPSYNWMRSRHDRAIETRERYSKEKLTELLKSQDFQILKASYFNSFFFIPILLKRMKDKILRSKADSSDVAPLNPLLVILFGLALFLEIKILRLWNLPVGLSVIIVGRKD